MKYVHICAFFCFARSIISVFNLKRKEKSGLTNRGKRRGKGRLGVVFLTTEYSLLEFILPPPSFSFPISVMLSLSLTLKVLRGRRRRPPQYRLGGGHAPLPPLCTPLMVYSHHQKHAMSCQNMNCFSKQEQLLSLEFFFQLNF